MKELEGKQEFSTFLAEAGGTLVVIDFFASWCGPCRQMAPIFKRLEGDFPAVKFAKIDVDDNSEIAEEYDIDVMPTFLFFKNGKEVTRISGTKKEELKDLIQKHQ